MVVAQSSMGALGQSATHIRSNQFAISDRAVRVPNKDKNLPVQYSQLPSDEHNMGTERHEQEMKRQSYFQKSRLHPDDDKSSKFSCSRSHPLSPPLILVHSRLVNDPDISHWPYLERDPGSGAQDAQVI